MDPNSTTRSRITSDAGLAELHKMSALYGGVRRLVDDILVLPPLLSSGSEVKVSGALFSESKLISLIKSERRIIRNALAQEDKVAACLFRMGAEWTDSIIKEVVEGVSKLVLLQDEGLMVDQNVVCPASLGILDLLRSSRAGGMRGRRAGSCDEVLKTHGYGKSKGKDAGILKHPQAMKGESLDADSAELLAGGLYGFADLSLKSNLIDRAVIALSVIPWLGVRQFEALCGLSICAVREGLFEDALRFSISSMSSFCRSARAFCIAGYCEMQSGRLKEAKDWLAIALRLSRGCAASLPDNRCAQGLLLSMYFS